MWSDDETSCLPFSYLINGQYEIIKKPWRPLLGEGFYVVYPDGWVKYYIDYTPYTSLVSWFADKTNNIFKTQEEAMQARQRVM